MSDTVEGYSVKWAFEFWGSKFKLHVENEVAFEKNKTKFALAISLFLTSQEVWTSKPQSLVFIQ